MVDTVGAGDTFQAALLTALAEWGLLTRAALAVLPVEALHQALGIAAQAAAAQATVTRSRPFCLLRYSAASAAATSAAPSSPFV